MVKLSGPLQSLAASGTLAGSVTFGKHARGTTLRKKPQPKHPRTQLQVASQAILTWVTRAWSTLTAPQKLTWIHADPDPDKTPYMKFVAWNTARLRDLLGPSKAYPPTETGTLALVATMTAAGYVRHAILTYQAFVAINDNWGMMFFRRRGAPPAKTTKDLMLIHDLDDLNPHTAKDTPLTPAQYVYKTFIFTNDGKTDTILRNQTFANVT